MAYNRFSINVIILSVAVALTGSLFFWTLTQNHLVIARFSSAIIWIILIAGLVSYVNRTNRGLTNFLRSVRNLDTSRPLPNHGPEYNLLDLTYSDIMESINEVKIEKEAEYQFFRSVIENMATGLICYDQDGKIELMNGAAARLLNSRTSQSHPDRDRSPDSCPQFLKDMPAGRNIVTRIDVDNEMVSLSVRKRLITRREKEIAVVSISNISSELEEEEIVVWQKLINVLSHEIMNSVSPIKSLTTTLSGKVKSQLSREDQTSLLPSIMEDLSEGLTAIEKRSRGLLQFVDSYRQISRIPEPEFSEVKVSDILADVAALMRNEAAAGGITITTLTEPKELVLLCDEKLLSQSLINLVSNAIYATEGRENSEIIISGSKEPDGRVAIRVTDSGKGIQPEILDKIFIPFFTTRGEGSGIGLSIVKQVMHLHRGSVNVKSIIGGRTTFTLRF